MSTPKMNLAGTPLHCCGIGEGCFFEAAEVLLNQGADVQRQKQH